MIASTVRSKTRKNLCAVSAVLLGALILGGGCAPYVSWYGAVDRGILETCNQAIAQEPNRMDHFRDRGIAHFTMGELDKALEDFDRAISIQLSANNRYEYWWLLRLYRLRGDVHYEMGNMEMAATDYNNAIEHINAVAERECSDSEAIARHHGGDQEMCYRGYTRGRDFDAAQRNLCYALSRIGDANEAWATACENIYLGERSIEDIMHILDRNVNPIKTQLGGEINGQIYLNNICRVRK